MTKISKRMTKNKEVLKILHDAKANTHSTLLRSMDREIILAILESIHNIILGNVPLTRKQFERLRRHRSTLKKIDKNTSFETRRKRLVQTGDGILKDILSPILALLGLK